MKRGAARCIGVLLWLAACGMALADTPVEICFDYSCLHQARATFSAADMAELAQVIEAASDAADERARVGEAIGLMYEMAGRQTPIHRDRGRNAVDDRSAEGSMDCIDHSTNSYAFLRLLEEAGLLKFHHPGERNRRFAFLVFGEHWAATLVENESGQAYAVDSWFFDPGYPAVVVPLARWKEGYDPGNKVTRAP